MEALIWFRSLAIVLLIVAHAVRHVHYGSPARTAQTQQANLASSATPLELTPELVDAIRAALAQVTVTEEQPQPAALTAPVSEQPKNASEREDEQR